MTKVLSLLVLASLSTNAAESSRIQPSVPMVEQILPQSWTAGQNVRVTLWGEFLDRALALQFDTDTLAGSVVDSSFTKATVQISIASTTPLGLHRLHLTTPRGSSNAFHFRVTGWKSTLEKEPNDALEVA